MPGIPSGYQTSADILRRIADHQETQEVLRKKIDALPEGHHERESLINSLFALHDEIEELASIAYTT